MSTDIENYIKILRERKLLRTFQEKKKEERKEKDKEEEDKENQAPSRVRHYRRRKVAKKDNKCQREAAYQKAQEEKAF